MTKLAEQLSALWALRNQPDHHPEPVTSSFAVTPANENSAIAKAEGLAGEKLLRIIPSIGQIMNQMRKPIERDAEGKTIAIGTLRFSDGKQTEKASMRGPDGDTIQYDRRMPAGAMLGTKETLTDDAGGSAAVTISNATFSGRFGVANHQHVPGRNRRRGKSYTAAESRRLLADAIANTPVMPPVQVFPAGIAAGTVQFSDQFIGMKIGSTGKGGAPHWVDVFMAGEDRIEDRKAHDELSMRDKTALQAALEGSSLADIGVAIGQGPEYARRMGGKRALIAANDNYAASVKKFRA